MRIAPLRGLCAVGLPPAARREWPWRANFGETPARERRSRANFSETTSRTAGEGSRRGLPAVGWSPPPGWAAIAGRERSLAWLLANRRLAVRYERRANLLQGFCIWPAR